MSALFLARLAVPRSALPVDGVLGRILVETFPPDGVVVKVKRNVCENGILSCRGKRVGIGLLVRAGGNAEETVLGVDSIKSAVGTLSDPGDIVADAPDLVALVSVSLGRDKQARLVLPQADGNAAQIYLTSPFGFSRPRISICSACQLSFQP